MNRTSYKFSILFFSILISQFFNLVNAQSFTELHSFNFYADSITNYSSTWIDIDQDYDYDLLKLSILNKPNQLYISNQNSLQKSSSVFQKDGGNANGACYADIDLDGDLDIFVYSIFGQKNMLYIQEGKGIFRQEKLMDITTSENNAFYACFSDVDADNDPDLLITDTELWNPKAIRRATKIYFNDGKGNFNKDDVEKFYVPKSDTRSLLLSDLNQDGREDLLLLNFGSENELYLKNDAHIFNPVTTNLSVFKGDYMDAVSIDIDNDADLDVLVASVNSGVDLYRNDGHLLFTRIENVFDLKDYKLAGIETLDWNKDGKLDVLLHKSFSNEKRLFINTSTTQHFIKLKLRADKANLNGIQTKVFVHTLANDRNYWQYKEVRATSKSSIADAFDLHFGIAEQTSIDSIKLIWPDGTVQYLYNIEADQLYFVEQRALPKRIDTEHILLDHAQYIRNISLSMVANYFKPGEISGITIFYENNGLIAEDVEVDLNLSIPMTLFNSFPMPQRYNKSNFHWTIKDVPAKFRGIITLSVNVPKENELLERTLKLDASTEPLIGDEYSKDNTVEKIVEFDK